MAFQDGLSSFLTTWSGVHTAYSFNQTAANSGTDTASANSATYGTATGYPNHGLAAACNPGPSGNLDIYIVTDAAMLLYIPAGLSHGTTYGLFHNGGGTHAQAGFLRATTTGVEICCTHNASGTPQDNVIHEIPDAQLPGWFAVGFQFAGSSGNQGDMALWIDGVKERSGTRTAQLRYGSGNPQIGDSNADHPLESACLDPSDYSGGNWGAESTINSTGILIANFVADNPNNSNSSPAGNGDTFYTDYFDAHEIAAATGSASVRASGVWEDIDSASVRVGGSWQSVDSIHVRVGGVWEQVWNSYTAISAIIDPATYNNSVSNSSGPYTPGFTCNVTGGDGTETYTWSVTNTVGSGWSISSGQGTDSVTLQCADGSDTLYSATLQCVVDDGTTSDSPSISISLTYGTPP